MSAVICMATYNGERWLPEQLDSLLAQTDQDWQLFVSDDGSADRTREILKGYIARDSRIQLLPPRSDVRGAAGNFEYLLTHVANQSSSPPSLIALCDQDDVWDVKKLALQRTQLALHAACCSDLLLTDPGGNNQGLRLLKQLKARAQPSLQSMLAQNSVVGCTLALRPDVLALALPFPRGLVNHDWWLAICVLAQADVFCDERALVHYRQHAGNVVGAYQPALQLRRLPQILTRQRNVLRSQLEAVRVLRTRLREHGVKSPQVLDRYVAALGGTSAARRVSSQAFGVFAAPHRPLRALRAAAVIGPGFYPASA